MNKWESVSASQFKVYALCKRKWWIERFSGLPRAPASPAQLLGTEVHQVLENHLKLGTPFPDTKAGRIAEAGLPHLPDPGTALTEHKVKLDSIDPPLVGYIDFFIVDGGDGCPEVGDFKTLSDWRWALTEEDLRRDLQMIPYAVFALEHTEADFLEVTHIQFITKGKPEARQVTVSLGREGVYKEWDKLKALALEMKETSKIENALDVEPCLSGCGAFGGCPFLDMCEVRNTNPFENIGFVSSKKEENMSEKNRLQELLERRRESGSSGETPVETSAFATFSEKNKGISPSEMGIVPPDAPKSKGDKEAVLQARYVMAGNKLLVLMRDRDINSLTQKELGEEIAPLFGMKRLRWNHIEAICATQEALTAKDSNRTVLFGLSPIVEEKPSQASPAVIRPPSLAKQVENPVQAVPKEKKEKNGRTGFTLYIDCFPLKGERPEILEDLLAPHIKKVSESHDIATPQLLDYAKGKAEVTALFCLAFPKTGEIVASSKSPYWASVEPYLVGAAAQVIRRFM